jgi:hypothetical protein
MVLQRAGRLKNREPKRTKIINLRAYQPREASSPGFRVVTTA